MTADAPADRTTRRRRLLVRLALAAVGLLVFTLLDRRLWEWLTIDPDKSLRRRDWFQVFRQGGSLFTWALISVCYILHDHRTALRRAPGDRTAQVAALHRGGLIFLGATLSGLAAEALLQAARRGRPQPDGLYRIGWFSSVHPYGLASSHAAVAIGAAMMIGWFTPHLRWPAYLLAAGTCASRLVEGAHFVTDIYVAFLLAWGVNALLRHLSRRWAGGIDHPAAALFRA